MIRQSEMLYSDLETVRDHLMAGTNVTLEETTSAVVNILQVVQRLESRIATLESDLSSLHRYGHVLGE